MNFVFSASATALENLPVELRGLASGIMQQGYAVGYLIAVSRVTSLAIPTILIYDVFRLS